MDERTVEGIERLRLTNLEAQAVEEIARRMGVDAGHALDLWYGSELCGAVERNEYGLQYLDANYLVDELLGGSAELDGVRADRRKG